MSKIEVDAIDKQSGSTLTLGGSGTAVTLASGATQSGFGRSGSVNWQTTPKTATFTAADGEGYFINSGSALTANLPAGSAGAIVAFSDYARNFATHNFTISPNGSEKIGGVAEDAQLNIDGQAATFVYVDATKGWVNVQNAEDTETGTPPFIQATGGTISESGDYRIHTFTGPGTFCVSSLSPTPANNVVSYVVVGGGGAGGIGGDSPGGGGAGGFREFKSPVDSYTASPLNGNPGGTSITATVAAFPITVGGGAPYPSTTGTPSVFSTVVSTGGGRGSKNCSPAQTAVAGGSGGGGDGGGNCTAGAGNTPPTTPSQGFPGGSGRSVSGDRGGGGGGGATAAGTAGSSYRLAGNGGAGATTSITGSPVAYAGGGGGAGQSGDTGTGGTGGGGQGGGPNPTPGVNGTANTGGGGGAGNGSGCSASGFGGSGVVIIRYKFQ
jgi:hypothetical protein